MSFDPFCILEWCLSIGLGLLTLGVLSYLSLPLFLPYVVLLLSFLRGERIVSITQETGSIKIRLESEEESEAPKKVQGESPIERTEF
jgi:hypothetical protein